VDSPLRAADDAIVIDSTGQSISEVIQRMVKIVKRTRRVMRLLRFTFKNEAIWMLISSLGLFLIGLVITLIVVLAGR
jgi:hypothetical protein